MIKGKPCSIKVSEKIKKVFRLYEEKFRHFCHKKECLDIHRCPKSCECGGRRKTLGLDTSIAWKMADLARNAMGDYTLIPVSEVIYIITVAKFSEEIVERHYHENKELSNLINGFYWSCMNIIPSSYLPY